jgi:FkbM family methyltransferase
MKKLKQTLRAVPLLGGLAKQVYRGIIPDVGNPSFWIDKYLKNRNLSIVQIGSNDGISGDPIFHLIKKNKKWKALFVEPVPYLFEKLKSNYKLAPRFIFENVAINDGSNEVFYWVKEDINQKIPNLPSWYDKLGSFNKEHILKYGDGILEPFIVETKVKGLTLKQLLERNKIDKIDLLHIDTEGYDWKILSQLNLDRYFPTIILFEHHHLSESEKEESIMFLKKDYHLFQFSIDFLCLRIDMIKKKDLNVLRERLIVG